MSNNQLGLGLCPFGIGIFGYGLPATQDARVSNLLEDSGKIQRDARYINPATQDYVLDSNGITSGMNAVNQQVYLALMTTFGTASVSTLGSTFRDIRTINSLNIQAEVEDKVAAALSDLIDANTISLVETTVQVNGNLLLVNVLWIDTLTGQLNQTQLNS